MVVFDTAVAVAPPAQGKVQFDILSCCLILFCFYFICLFGLFCFCDDSSCGLIDTAGAGAGAGGGVGKFHTLSFILYC